MLCGNFRGIRSQHLLDSIWKWAARPVVILSLVSLLSFVPPLFWFSRSTLLTQATDRADACKALHSRLGASPFLHGQCHVATITPAFVWFVCFFYPSVCARISVFFTKYSFVLCSCSLFYAEHLFLDVASVGCVVFTIDVVRPSVRLSVCHALFYFRNFFGHFPFGLWCCDRNIWLLTRNTCRIIFF